jgi:hypothetical protein
VHYPFENKSNVNKINKQLATNIKQNKSKIKVSNKPNTTDIIPHLKVPGLHWNS